MTHQAKIEFVKQKCIAANSKMLCPGIGKQGHQDNLCPAMRPIRLADVLLAVKHKDIEIEKSIEKISGRGGAKCTHLYSTLMTFASVETMGHEFWALSQDDLAEQSEETIEFFYQLFS